MLTIISIAIFSQWRFDELRLDLIAGINAAFSGNGLASYYINMVLDVEYVFKIVATVHWLTFQQRHNHDSGESND